MASPYTRSIVLDDFNVGDTDRIELTIRKNHAAWDDIDSVDLVFEKPDRTTQFTRSATLLAGEVWYYDLVTADIDTVGWWTLGVYVSDGVIRKKYPYEISFLVTDNP